MVTFKAIGRVIGVYRDGELQTYWKPTDGVHRLNVIVTVLRGL